MHIIYRGFDALISFRVGFSLGSMGQVTFKNKTNKQTNKTNPLKNPNQTKKPKKTTNKKPQQQQKSPYLTPLFLQNLPG